MRNRLRALAPARPRFGYRRLTVLLRREYGAVNHKRVYRWYRQEGLQVRRRRRRKRVAISDQVLRRVPDRAGEQWAMDFMRDTLTNGRRFRTLNVVDACARECLAIAVDTSLPGLRVTGRMRAPGTSPPAPLHRHGEGRGGVPRCPPPSADAGGVLPLAIAMETGCPLAGGVRVVWGVRSPRIHTPGNTYESHCQAQDESAIFLHRRDLAPRRNLV